MEIAIVDDLKDRRVLIKNLAGNRFLECYRNIIINMNYIDAPIAYDFILKSSKKIPISRRKKAPVMGKYMFYFNNVRVATILIPVPRISLTMTSPTRIGVFTLIDFKASMHLKFNALSMGLSVLTGSIGRLSLFTLTVEVITLVGCVTSSIP